MKIRFVTYTDSLKLDGDRHLQNAHNHLALGNVKYAIGSLKKAIKFYERYQTELDFKAAMPKALKSAMDQLSNQIVNSIMNGSINGETNLTRTISK